MVHAEKVSTQYSENDLKTAVKSMLNAIGATFLRDIEPGEVVVVTMDGIRAYKPEERQHTGLCVFEFIYNARPDSVIDGASVHEARLQAGAFLAREHPVDADVVIGLYREDYYDKDLTAGSSLAEAIILKNRKGETGKVELAWLPEYTSFGSVEKRRGEDD